MQEAMQAGGEADNDVFGAWMEFVPVIEDAGDRQVTQSVGLGAVAGLETVEPFGTEQAVDLSADMAKKPEQPNTGGATGPKGEGKFDDYKTRSE